MVFCFCRLRCSIGVVFFGLSERIICNEDLFGKVMFLLDIIFQNDVGSLMHIGSIS